MIAYVLDLDRTLARTDRLYDRFVAGLASSGLASLAEVNAARAATEASGGSFDVVAWLTDQAADPSGVGAWLAAYSYPTKIDESLRMPGATDLIKRITASGAPLAIMTYGSEPWQRAKLGAAGWGDLPVLVVDSPAKARAIVAWRDGSGRYRLPAAMVPPGGGQLADRVVLVDDKAAAFTDLPDDGSLVGYWLVPPAQQQLLLSQQGTVPPRVRRIQSLDQVVVSWPVD